MAGYVSEAVIKRLPAYYRHLKELEKEGIHQISSQGLGNRMHLTASQIRQDLNNFGGFGQPLKSDRTSTVSADLAARDMAIPSADCASISAIFWEWTAPTA